MGDNTSTQHRFVHLRAHSAYSLSEGAIKVKSLIRLAKDNAMPALGLTDSGNLFGALEFSQEAKKEGVQPIIGVVINLALEPAEEGVERNTGKLVLIAKDELGYYNLIKLVSKSYIEAEDSSFPIMELDYFDGGMSVGIIALTGGYEGLLNQAIVNGNLDNAKQILLKLDALFTERLYIELGRHGLADEEIAEKQLMDLAIEHNIPLVATNNCMFSTRDMFEAQDILMCISGGNYVSETNRRRYTKEHYFKAQDEMCELFADIPEAIENSLVIAQRCHVLSPARDPMLPSMEVEGSTEDDELCRIGREGLQVRLDTVVFPAEIRKREKESEGDNAVSLSDADKKEIAAPYKKRLEFELDIICEMGFPGYFLIVSDFISWSKKMDIPVGPGRGSGAGSVVAWVMLITDLDPLRYGLLFERFLNPERVSMPDFDIDFCQDRRDEVISYVQEKYGKDRVSMIITFGKLQAKAVLRDVGRVLQMSYMQVDSMCKLIPFNPANPLSLQEAIDLDSTFNNEAKKDEQVAKLLEIGLKLEGLYRHAGTHAAGVVIGAKPLDEMTPLYKDSRSEIPATQFSMKYAEMAGLVKFDFLGLKTLTTIDAVCKIVREQGGDIDIDHIPLDDPATFEMLAKGDSTGVFQMESAGMRDALRKMKPDTIEDIIALISLYRPGPMENIPTYIARKHGLEKPDYLHPKLEPCLKETFGVIIYQEQVMEIAKVLSGYSLGGADLLRRAMGKKIAAEMDIQRELFMEGAKKNDVDPAQAGMIFDLVAKFAGYGFNKSHAAAYAWIGYQTAYLKANYPVEFLAGSMNVDIGDTDKLNIFAQEALASNVQILQPDVNISHAYFKVETLDNPPEGSRKRGVRYGLAGLKGVGMDAMVALIDDREKSGLFNDVFDMARRCDNRVMNKRQLEGMAKAGAFDALGMTRKQMCDGATSLCRYHQSIMREKESNQTNLFGEEEQTKDYKPAGIIPDVDEWLSSEKWKQEYSAVGFYLTGHPLNDLQSELQSIPMLAMAGEHNKRISDGGKYKLCGMVTAITMRSSARGRFAYLYLSDPTGNMEMSIFNEKLIDENIDNFKAGKPLLVSVDARRDEGGVRLQVNEISLLENHLQSKKYKVIIDLNENKITELNSLTVLKNCFKKNDKARAIVKLMINTKTGMSAEIILPGFYDMPDNYESILSEIDVVRKLVVS